MGLLVARRLRRFRLDLWILNEICTVIIVQLLKSIDPNTLLNIGFSYDTNKGADLHFD